MIERRSSDCEVIFWNGQIYYAKTPSSAKLCIKYTYKSISHNSRKINLFASPRKISHCGLIEQDRAENF